MKNVKYISKLLITFGFLLVFTGIFAAALFDPSNPPPGYVGGLALSTTDLEYRPSTDVDPNQGGGKAYRPWYEVGTYQGDLIEYDIDTLGRLTTTVDFSVSPPIVPVGGNWSARVMLDAMDWDAERKVITRNGGQVAFRWSNLSDAQKTALDPLTPLIDPASPVVDFLRGDRTNEQPLGALRQRFSAMGDNMHSTPIYVSEPRRPYSFDDYLTFQVNNAGRAPRVYMGSNDGMVHAFDAKTGSEVYAYVPSLLMPRLNRLSNSPYVHGYYVDGQLTDADVQFGTEWKSILVGGLGAGGKGYFALDITNPDLSDEASSTGSDAKILWEIDDSGSAGDDLGYSYSRAAIHRFNDGKWYAAIGNGYNSVNGNAVLMLIDVTDGSIRKLQTGSGSVASPNGLSSPTLFDADGDARTDMIYAGDIDGNLWKFDVSDVNPSNWGVAYSGTPLYTGASSQPITVQPDISTHPTNNGRLVYFGTGRLFTLPEVNNTDIQAAFAIWDKDVAPVSQNLLTQTITETTFAAPSGTKRIRTISNNPIDWTTHTGWTVPLPAGERILARARYRALRLQFISTNPTIDGTENWLMQPSRANGGEPTVVVFNLNEDGVLDNNDKSGADIPVGIYIGLGVNSHTVFAHITQGVDTLFINNLSPPFDFTCTGVCIGGLRGGHMDVDTDSPAGDIFAKPVPFNVNDGPVGLGGNSDGHEHEYDEDHGITYVDMFEIEPRRGDTSLDVRTGTLKTLVQELNSVEEVRQPDGSPGPIPGTKRFIAVLANADLSPGGIIKIGDKEWNVQVYQDMMVDRLQNGKPLVDQDGDSLVFTLDAIRATGTTGATGTPADHTDKFRITFDNQAIIEGGLMPTIWTCPKGHQDPYNFTKTGGHPWVDPSLNKHITAVPKGLANDPTPAVSGYRWRNGTLVMQLLDVDAGFVLQDWVHMPTDKAGKVTGGVHAKAYSLPPTKTKGAKTTPGAGPNQSGLLYEVFMYWHYGDLYEDIRVGNKAPCYGVGAAQWTAAAQIERNGLTAGEYLALLNGLTAESQEVIDFVAALDAVEACLADDTCTKAELDIRLKTLADAITVSPEFQKYVYYRPYAGKLIPDSVILAQDRPDDPGVPPAEVITPLVDDTKVDNQTLINGLNDNDGAHSWVDLTP